MRYQAAFSTLLLVTLLSCQTPPPFNQADLTNNGKGKYWDQVYATDVYGHINASYNDPQRHYSDARRGKVKILHHCDYFQGKGKVTHYLNVDSVNVMDRGANTDSVFNPDTYTLRDSLLTFGGHIHKVLTLTQQVMVLEYQFEQHKAIQVYLPSKYQYKQVLLPSYPRFESQLKFPSLPPSLRGR